MTASLPAALSTLDIARNRQLAIWLLISCAMVFVMVVLGGLTRLTHSGLSMVEWKPLMGILPPLGEGEWQDIFAKYQAYPQYQKLNSAMTLPEFKGIFWLEYIHRLWGRAIGLVFFAPFLFFLAKGYIGKNLRPHLAVIFVLGALQGLLGWYMVKSGLVERPDVSQYRLSAHLIAAFIIYGYMLWVAFGLLHPIARSPASSPSPALLRLAWVVAGMTFLTVFSGGFVAGLDAGLAYNTFPLMGGQLVPQEYLDLTPWYLNLFENIAAVQFDHRVLATLTLCLIAIVWFKGRKEKLSGPSMTTLNLMMAVALIQVALGISTLLLFVPLGLAASHQAGALFLFTLGLWTAFSLRFDLRQ